MRASRSRASPRLDAMLLAPYAITARIRPKGTRVRLAIDANRTLFSLEGTGMKFPSLKYPALRPDDLEPRHNSNTKSAPRSTFSKETAMKKSRPVENCTFVLLEYYET